MLRRIQNVFEYLDYRIVLADDFMLRSTGNHKYSIRAYARDLQLSPGFVSDVLSGKKDFSAETGREAFARLGFDPMEIDYVESIINFNISNLASVKEAALDLIRQKFQRSPLKSDNARSLILKSADHFILHGIVGGVADESDILSLADKMGIGPDRAKEVLAEMAAAGYFTLKDSRYFLVHLNLNVAKHEELLSLQRDFSNRLVDLMQKQGGMNPPESVGHSLAFGLDRNTFPIAVEAYKQLINTLSRLSEQTPVAERYAFYSASFFSVLAPAAADIRRPSDELDWNPIPV
ncbi:hypothetical protein BH10BDE1_BH10BDE1_33300 [soil metagenome]